MQAEISEMSATWLIAAAFVNPWKLLAVAILGGAWAKYAEWADKDAVAVNTYRIVWNLLTLVVGIIVLGCALLVPVFWIGQLAGWLVFIGFGVGYVVHRNGLVEPQYTLLTSAHWQRIQEQGLFGRKKGKKREVAERVQLRGPRGVVRMPEEDEARERFGAAQDLLYEMLLRRANRLELAASGEVAKVALEIDGQALEREPLPRAAGDGIVLFIKESLGLNLEEKRKPQIGKLTAKTPTGEFELRVRTDGSVAGEKLTLRVLGPEKKWRVTDLGFTDRQLSDVQAVLTGEPGVILIGGPRRNGITTTIYSFARSHDAFLQNIQLLEYTNEIEIDNVTQKVYAQNEAVSFTDELLKMIRSDPDILIVPEIREAAAPLQIARAGQKVKLYTTVNATDISETVRKWMQLVGDNDAAGRTLRAVVNQRLVRKLCPQCREAYKPDAGLLKKLNLPPDSVLYRVPQAQYDKNGNPILCPGCQGAGYIGRAGVFEIIQADDALRDVVRRGGAVQDIQAVVSRAANANLQRQGMAKVLDGTTSIQELVRVLRGEAPPGPGGAQAAAKGASKPPSKSKDAQDAA